MIEFDVPMDYFTIYSDSVLGLTQLFVGDYPNNRIVRYDIDSTLNVTETSLPVDYGLPWLVADLDLDGQVELVRQRGDNLDIFSAPDWTLRQRFSFPGMNVVMSPALVNVDDDPQLEIYVTPHATFFGPARVVLIDYSFESGTFEIISDIPAPYGAMGTPAVGDFDNDGKCEFISATYDSGYALYEWQDTDVVYVGLVGGPDRDYGFAASAVRPFPGGVLHALLGHSELEISYELLAPTGDNTFEIVHVFQNWTGASGYHPNLGADVDCDGLDELVMSFWPRFEVWEWDVESETFAQGCGWLFDSVGSSKFYHSADLDHNGAADWVRVNHEERFMAFPNPNCVSCDTLGHCPYAGQYCECYCHGDPQCDSTIDVLDVVRSVAVAFRNAPFQPDPHPFCPPSQADVDCNGVTDVLDVVRFVNVAFRNEDPAANFCDPCAP